MQNSPTVMANQTCEHLLEKTVAACCKQHMFSFTSVQVNLDLSNMSDAKMYYGNKDIWPKYYSKKTCNIVKYL